jgi:hypothetical protein
MEPPSAPATTASAPPGTGFTPLAAATEPPSAPTTGLPTPAAGWGPPGAPHGGFVPPAAAPEPFTPPAGSAPPAGSWGPPGAPTTGFPAPDAGWPPPPGWQHPGFPPPKPKSSRAAVIVTVVAVVVVLACLGFGTAAFFTLRHDDSLDQASSRPDGSPTAFPTDEPTDQPDDQADSTHTGDIKQFITERPTGAKSWPDAKADQALNLAAAAANFADPAEGKLILQRYHFKDGYERRWIDDEGDFIAVRVLRFAAPGDGDNFTNFYIDANQGTGWGDPQPVPGIDTAAGFVQPKPSKTGFQRTLAVGNAGDIVAIVLADQLPPASASVPDSELIDEFGLL